MQDFLALETCRLDSVINDPLRQEIVQKFQSVRWAKGDCIELNGQRLRQTWPRWARRKGRQTAPQPRVFDLSSRFRSRTPTQCSQEPSSLSDEQSQSLGFGVLNQKFRACEFEELMWNVFPQHIMNLHNDKDNGRQTALGANTDSTFN